MWPLNPHDFFDLAKELAEVSPTSDVKLRTSIGRVYYALFHISKDRLISIQELEETAYGDIHSKVVTGVKGIKKNIGEKLDAIKRMRTQADYALKENDPIYNEKYQDWGKNWQETKTIADLILPHLKELKRHK